MSSISEERRNRINVSLWAYAYEFKDDSIVSDEIFDKTCYLIDPNVSTGNNILDTFFKEKFEPYTGQWVREHPELDKLDKLYYRLKKNNYKRKRERL